MSTIAEAVPPATSTCARSGSSSSASAASTTRTGPPSIASAPWGGLTELVSGVRPYVSGGAGLLRSRVDDAELRAVHDQGIDLEAGGAKLGAGSQDVGEATEAIEGKFEGEPLTPFQRCALAVDFVGQSRATA